MTSIEGLTNPYGESTAVDSHEFASGYLQLTADRVECGVVAS